MDSLHVQYIGHIWQPGVGLCAQEQTFTVRPDGDAAGDDFSGPFTRDDVASHLALHAGDFQEVTDFRATLGTRERFDEMPWGDEESEWTFNDCMDPDPEPCACGEC